MDFFECLIHRTREVYFSPCTCICVIVAEYYGRNCLRFYRNPKAIKENHVLFSKADQWIGKNLIKDG